MTHIQEVIDATNEVEKQLTKMDNSVISTMNPSLKYVSTALRDYMLATNRCLIDMQRRLDNENAA